jgi:hypothetical protein
MRVAQFRRSVECNIARINSAADIVLGHHESMLVARGFTRAQPCAAPQRHDRRDRLQARLVATVGGHRVGPASGSPSRPGHPGLREMIPVGIDHVAHYMALMQAVRRHQNRVWHKVGAMVSEQPEACEREAIRHRHGHTLGVSGF